MGILIDVSGGANPPHTAIQAAAELTLQGRQSELILVGEEKSVTKALSTIGHDPANLVVKHVPEGQTTLSRAMELLAAGEGDALVTATRGDELVNHAREHLRLISGVRQPALCAVYPTPKRRGKRQDNYVLILDVGARLDANADELVGFARMGAAYASRVSRNKRPKVGLLAPRGIERGSDATRAAAAFLLQERGLEFCGGVTGTEIATGNVDVIVCDGYGGSLVRQFLEGIPSIVTQFAGSAQSLFKRSLTQRLISDDIEQLKSRTDWKGYGGAPLLGYEFPVIITDPDVGPGAVQNAIKLAGRAVHEDIVGAVKLAFA